MTNYPAFKPIPRLHRPFVVTEKIDGTNGLIMISDGYTAWDQEHDELPPRLEWDAGFREDVMYVAVGSRNRWLTLEQDNFGFALWVQSNIMSLVDDLGPGMHYGEWWGQGIQRRYGLDHKRFSLFNTARWSAIESEFKTENLRVVPVLIPPTDGGSLNMMVFGALRELRTHGSVAAPGFMNPEGVVVYHTAAKALFKATIENDQVPKQLAVVKEAA